MSDMKKRFLHFGLLAVCFGLNLIFLSALSMAGQPGDLNSKRPDGTRWATIRANQHTGVVSPADLFSARQEAASLRTKSTTDAMNLNWFNAGPDNYAGIIWSAIFDKTDQTGLTILAGSESGGIWKSTNLGLTWNPMLVEGNEVLKVSSMVQASNGTVYAATGITSCKTITLAGTGIYKSENNNSFSVIPSTHNNPDFEGITKLALDANSGRMFAATSAGLFYTDNVNDWTKVKTGYVMDVCVGPDGSVITAIDDSAYLSVGGNMNSWINLTTGEPTTLPKGGIGWMTFAIAPSDANVMYASLAKPDGKLLNIYLSVDKGATWSVIFPSNPTFEPFNGEGCYANTLAVFPDDPYQVLLGGINMWYGTRVQPTGYYNWEIASSGYYSPWFPNSAPANHHGYMFRPNNKNNLVLATDGGVSVGTNTVDGFQFQTSNKNLACGQFNAIAVSTKQSFVMGGGQNIGSLAMGYFYPTYTNGPTDGFPVWSDGLLLNSYGGPCVWSNVDYNIGVFTIQGAATPMLRRDFRDLTYDNNIMNGVIAVNSNHIPMHLWESFTFTQSKDSVKLYARVNTIPADTLVQVESSNGVKFPYYTTAPINKGDSLMVQDPVASRFFYYGNKVATSYGRGIYMTKDMLKFYKDPEYFYVLSDTASKVDLINAFAVSADLNTLWAGTVKGRIFRLTGLINATDSVTANEFSPQCVLVKNLFANTPMAGRTITSISINPKNSNEVLFTLGNYGNQDYVYFTSNGGAAEPTFTSVQSNLPKAPVYSGLIEMHGNNAIVGTDVGLYSTNGLTSGAPQWGAEMENIGDVVITEIKQQAMQDYHIINYGAIYLASYGRGIWMDTTYLTPVGIDSPVAESLPSLGKVSVVPNPVRDQMNIKCVTTEASMTTVTVIDLMGRAVMQQNFGFQPKGTFTGILNVSNLPSGTYFVKIGSASGKFIKL